MGRNSGASREARRGLVIVSVLVIVLGAALFGYWAYQRGLALDAPARIAGELRAQGFEVAVGPAEVVGAPSRLDARIDGVWIAGGGWSLSFPTLESKAVVYRDDYVALTAPEGATLATPTGPIAIRSERLRASLVFEGTALARLAVDAPSSAATPEDGRDGLRAARAQFFMRRPDAAAAADGAYEARFRATALTRPGVETALDLDLVGMAAFGPAPARTPARLGALVRVRLAPESALRLGADALTFSGELQSGYGGAWTGRLSFATDAAPRLLEALEELELIEADAAAALRARIADSGRLAGVLAINGDRVEAHDLAPEPIRLRRAVSLF